MRFVSERRWPLCITVSPRPYEVPQMAPAPDHRRDLDTVLLVSFTTIQDTAPSRVESLRSASVGRSSPHCTQLSPHPSTLVLLVWGEALPIHVMVYGRFERGRPRSGRSRVRFVLFWYGCCLHALENRRAWPTNAGRSAEDSRGSGLPRLAPLPGLDGPPSGGPRDGLTARISTLQCELIPETACHCARVSETAQDTL